MSTCKKQGASNTAAVKPNQNKRIETMISKNRRNCM